MTGIDYAFLFLLGTAFGSFLNVVIFRYDPDRHLLKNVNGRSHCMSCGRTLRWHELIPLFSFLFQMGRCRTCKATLSWQYPLVELLAGIMFVLVPLVLTPIGFPPPYLQVIIWLIAFLCLIILSVIDFRTRIIPDELNILIAFLGVAQAALLTFQGNFGEISQGLYPSLLGTHSVVHGSFLGTQAMILWITHAVWLNALFGALFGGGLLAFLYFGSGGRAMGFGDVKLAFAAGLLLGFPDMVLSMMLAFIIGAASGLALILLKKKTGLKDSVPFGPFIALGITLTFFFGYDIVNAYFRFFSFIF